MQIVNVAVAGLLACALAGCESSDALQQHWQLRPDGPEILNRAAIELAESRTAREQLLHALQITQDWHNCDEKTKQQNGMHTLADDRNLATVDALLQMVKDTHPSELAVAMTERFEVWELKTADVEEVLYTAYFAPEFEGSLVQTVEHRFPLYARPVDSKKHSATRRAIEADSLLAGSEVVWLRDGFDAYVVHVNGSARILLEDGSHVNVAHVATNELPYTSLGKLLIADGKLDAATVSLKAIREYFQDHPEKWLTYAWQNDRFVFFELLADDHWPRSGAGMTLTPGRSLAVDPVVYPMGAPVIVQTTMMSEPFERIMMTEDIGGAIKGEGRADIYVGVGNDAGIVAGQQNAKGRLMMVLLKESGASSVRGWLAPGR